MDRFLYEIKKEEEKTFYKVRTYQTYLFNIGIFMVLLGFFIFKPMMYVGGAFVVYNSLSKLLAFKTTKKLFRIQKEGRLSATGNKLSFRTPLTFIEHAEEVK